MKYKHAEVTPSPAKSGDVGKGKDKGGASSRKQSPAAAGKIGKLGPAEGKTSAETPCAFEKLKKGSCKLGDKCKFLHGVVNASPALLAAGALASTVTSATGEVIRSAFRLGW